MKKIGLLALGAFILTACDASPGGNKDIMPVVHDEPVEHVEHHAEEAHGHGHETDSAHHEIQPTANDSTATAQETMSEPKGSAH